MIAVDIETYDPKLKTDGDGSIRMDGKITGVAFYRPGVSGYVRPDDKELVRVLTSDEPKIFHNATYDLAWLQAYGYKVNGKVYDTLTRASLIEPNANAFSLDTVCKRFEVAGKNYKDTVQAWWEQQGRKGKAIEHMDEVPFSVQAEYAKQDVKATYELYEKQQPHIDSLQLQDVDTLESDLIPVIMRMKKNGIKIDERGRDKLRHSYLEEIVTTEDDILMESGIVNVNSTDQLAEFFHGEGITSPFTTETGNESWDKNALNAIDHPIAKKILKVKSRKTVLGTFLDSALQKTVNGRLHTTFYPTNRDEGGTITGRFSSAHPNLQNIPSSEDKGGKEIRSLFLPDEDCLLGAFDYKQIEYRIFAHYAIKFQEHGWEALYEAMQAEKDYHQFVMDMLGWDASMRKLAKTLNFGILYGMGKAKCLKMNRSLFHPRKDETVEDYADWVYDTYFKSLPFVKPTCRHISNLASKNGYVRGIDGRRHVTQVGAEYRSVNYLIQGSAAGILKIGMVEAEKAGVWDYLPLHLTVHDELVFSIPQVKASKEAMVELIRCMQTPIKFNVPIGVDTEIGADWAHVDKETYYGFAA